MRIKEESLLEYIDLNELSYPLTNNTGLKQIGHLVKRNESSYKVSNYKCDRACDIQKKQDLISNNLQEVVYRMIG